MITDVAIVKCPKCNRISRIPRLYAPGQKGIKKIAINHEDHFLIIGFDRYGVVRYSDVFETLRQSENYIELPVSCNICGRKISVPNGREVKLYAIDHGDHCILVYRAGNEIEIEIVNIIKQVHAMPKRNMIKQILRSISKDELAFILVETIKNPGSVIYVSQNIYSDIKALLKKIFGKEGNIRIGITSIRVDSSPLDFIKSKLDEVEDLSDEEAVSMLQETVELITSLRDSILKIRKLYGIDEACKYLLQLEKSNLSLFKLINSIVKIKC